MPRLCRTRVRASRSASRRSARARTTPSAMFAHRVRRRRRRCTSIPERDHGAPNGPSPCNGARDMTAAYSIPATPALTSPPQPAKAEAEHRGHRACSASRSAGGCRRCSSRALPPASCGTRARTPRPCRPLPERGSRSRRHRSQGDRERDRLGDRHRAGGQPGVGADPGLVRGLQRSGEEGAAHRAHRSRSLPGRRGAVQGQLRRRQGVLRQGPRQPDPRRAQLRPRAGALRAEPRRAGRPRHGRGGGGSSRADVETAEASMLQARAGLDQAVLNLSYTRITSPIDGIVISRNIDVGQTVAASFQAPTLFTIAQDLTKMQVDTNVAEGDVGKIHEKMEATFTVDAYPRADLPRNRPAGPRQRHHDPERRHVRRGHRRRQLRPCAPPDDDGERHLRLRHEVRRGARPECRPSLQAGRGDYRGHEAPAGLLRPAGIWRRPAGAVGHARRRAWARVVVASGSRTGW